ncbi:DUF488 family protein [Alicyclobacillus cycloheptanicus]|uniref:Uncharacterized protein YeaO (DUF488 family) n=1 Tax=Alicyclobacillus cycloheptanicus TaxID=1457 RepID=A0ABT9XMY3_9BACL|nr:DUF488 family protein [Alicyclobacillus cycloheptanicus]MDQ0191088.1 uncharacterized protein YeaO (DUF488 family) [Alicyclobacillus cycloheptanicus]WDM00881.1 DUF488 family protein [Alicyclobacillus cycloheptanicus]
MNQIRLQHKRIYEPIDPSDGMRILVDRLWPRGVRKDAAKVDVWLKEIAPSPDLRSWFDHNADRFPAFRTAYEMELSVNEEHRKAVAQVMDWLQDGSVTLLYAAKDPHYNHVVVLHDFLMQQIEQQEVAQTEG